MSVYRDCEFGIILKRKKFIFIEFFKTDGGLMMVYIVL